jgi:hypothetical protein
MNTLTIEHVDESTTELFKLLAEKLGLSIIIKEEKEIINSEL